MPVMLACKGSYEFRSSGANTGRLKLTDVHNDDDDLSVSNVVCLMFMYKFSIFKNLKESRIFNK